MIKKLLNITMYSNISLDFNIINTKIMKINVKLNENIYNIRYKIRYTIDTNLDIIHNIDNINVIDFELEKIRNDFSCNFTEIHKKNALFKNLSKNVLEQSTVLNIVYNTQMLELINNSLNIINNYNNIIKLTNLIDNSFIILTDSLI